MKSDWKRTFTFEYRPCPKSATNGPRTCSEAMPGNCVLFLPELHSVLLTAGFNNCAPPGRAADIGDPHEPAKPSFDQRLTSCCNARRRTGSGSEQQAQCRFHS